MPNFEHIPWLDPAEDLTSAVYVNTKRLGKDGTIWVRTPGSVPTSNTNLHRPGPSGNYWQREFTPTDFSMNPGRAGREQVMYSYDFAAPGAFGPFSMITNGTGAGSSSYNASADANPLGLTVLSTGTAASGSVWIGTAVNFYTASQNGRVAVEAVFATPTFSVPGSEEFAFVPGLTQNLTNVGNNIGFRVDVSATTGRVITNGSTSGTPLTALTTTANTRYRVRVEHFYASGAYQARYFMRAEPTYISPREWPWVPADLIGTITEGVGGVVFPTGAFGVGVLLRKLAGTTARTGLLSQLIISTGF